jgi:hypothetical protein
VEVESGLRAAVQAGVLVERGQHRLVFSHELVREALYRELAPALRVALHRAVAEALDGRGGGERPWAELAHHWLEAGPAAMGQAVAASIAAAEGALDALAYEDAIGLLDRARAALELLPPDPRARAELLLAEGLARLRAGEVERGRALCARAAELARALGDADLFARAALGYGAEFTFGAIDPLLVRLLEEALAGLPGADSALRARLLARLASALQPAIDPSQPVRVAREAIAMARRLRDEPALLAVIHAAVSAMMDYVRGEERALLNSEAERLAGALHDRPRLLRARARLVFDYLEMGALARADECVSAYEALARELKSARSLWQVPLMRSMRAAMEGRFDECERWIGEAKAQAVAANDPSRHWTLAYHRLGLYRVQERHDDLLALEGDIRAAFGTTSMGELWSALACASIRARRGAVDEAVAQLRGQEVERFIGVADSSSLGLLAEIAAASRDGALAARLYPLMVPLAEDLMSYGMMGMFCEGPFHRQLGLLAAALGRPAEAARHLEAAITRTRQLGLRPHLARLLFESAGIVASTDAPEAARRLEEARGLARSLGLTGLLRQIDAARPEGAPAPPPLPVPAPAPGAPTFELRREGDYWTVAAAGTVLRLKDSRGLQILHQLVSHPDREFHATDLAATGEGVKDGGDAGELLDRQARAEYRDRVAALEDELAEAERFGDPGRAARAREELEFLAAELSRAVGLGGRDRKGASPAERARVAVQKRLKEAIKKIEEAAPGLGRHLASTIRTGAFCSYSPAGRRP